MGYGADILRKKLTPHAAYFELLNALYARHFRVPARDPDDYWHRVFALSPGERAFLLTNEMTGEVGNDGFGQYFDNTGYQRPHETIRAFTLIGATKSAEFLRKALEIAKIPDPLPPTGNHRLASMTSSSRRPRQTYVFMGRALVTEVAAERLRL